MVFTPSRPLECPTQCRCSNYKTWCKYSRLYKLPSHLPNTTKLLSIEYDDIKILNSSMVTSSGLWNLTYLKLNIVQLQQIEPGSFRDVNLLQKLIITNNNISKLHADTFKYLNNLYYLNLQDNKITHLQVGVFSHLVNVRYFNLIEEDAHFPTDVSNIMINSSNCQEIKTPGVLELLNPFGIENTDLRAIQHFLCFFTQISIYNLASTHIPKDAFVGATRVTDLKLVYKQVVTLNNVFNGLEELLKLQIEFRRLRDIEIGAFDDLTLLKNLEISNSNIRQIRSGTFRGLRSLKVLKLKHIHISTLEKNMFEGLQSLERLYLDYCRIRIINNDTFVALKSLRELFILSFVLFQIDADAFNGLRQIKIINIFTLYTNGIIPLKNDTLPKLKTLDVVYLPKGKFSLEDGTFAEVWTTQIFSKDISHRFENVYYTDIEYEINLQRLTFVMMATFGDIGIRATVKSVQGHQTLKELQLFVNGKTPNLNKQVQNLINNTVNFTKLNQISHLDITNYNSVTFKENSFLGFPSIKSLTLNIATSGEIHSNAFNQLKSLTFLTINNNQHVAIAPGAFTGLCNLKKLELYISQTSDVNKRTLKIHGQNYEINVNVSRQFEAGTFLGLDNLKILRIQDYKYVFDDEGLFLMKGMFQGLYNVTEIHMGSNGIKKIPPAVFGAECVEHFKLSCKNVTESSPYCNDTHALKTLKFLDLSFNQIQHIHQHAFISCLNLKILNLEWNTMLTLDNTFFFTPALTLLKLVSCNVTNIPNNTFECSRNISELSLTIYKLLPHVTPFLPLKQLKEAYIYIYKYNLTCDFYETWLWFEDKHITPYLDNHPDPGGALYKLKCNITYHHISQQLPNNKVDNYSFYLKQYIEPIILIVITTSGIAFNGFLLFVSLWNLDMRTKHNSCIINLSITDTLSLILNLPLSYWNTLHVNWELGVVTCKMLMFLKDVTLVSNIFSIVALSVERFLVARRWKNLRKACKTDYPTWWLLVMTWVSGIILSLPAYYNASVHTRCLYCPPNNEEYIKNVWVYQFIVHYFLPAVVICALNTMTSRNLKQSIKKHAWSG
ncbi:hypothetical protein L9F63_024144 [Diploptera punctata]|uniref:G-protein coupled receptors family 1 profile domain-containing protein n=1 Tax=Diploptera punctata TaxID=6984 RepID=A0AAD8E8L5_DIPPU|nr:hypothetical protein L9F63_024144 [Diploptera punctata]